MSSTPFGKNINFPITLAPMVGLSHISFRLMLREYLPKKAETLWPTEMLNSRKIPKQDLATNPLSLKGPDETNMAPQILGNEEKPIKDSLKCLELWGANSIDINMGCPVKKALRHNYGVALMGDVKYARSVVEMTVKNTKLPVSVKLRAGFQNDLEFLKKFVLEMQDGGVSWLTLHPRLAIEKRRGRADWSQITFVKNQLSIPVIGNGDVQTSDDAFRMLELTGCDMVMVGRALTARPWLLWQVAEKLGYEAPTLFKGRKAPCTPEEEAQEYGRSLLRLVELTQKYFELRPGLLRLKYYIKVSHVWLNFGHSFNTQVLAAKTFEELRNIITQFFQKSSLAMTQKTNLRE